MHKNEIRNFSRIEGFSLLGILILDLLSLIAGLITLNELFLYLFHESSHPVLSSTIDENILISYGFLAFLGTTLSGIATIIDVIIVSQKRTPKNKRKISSLLFLMSIATLIFCASRYRFLWTLN